MNTRRSPGLLGVRALRLHSPAPDDAATFYGALTYRLGSDAETTGPDRPVMPEVERLPTSEVGGWTVGLGVEDLAAGREAVVAHGGKVLAASIELGRLTVEDTQGLVVDLVTASTHDRRPVRRGDVLLADAYVRDVEATTEFWASAMRLDVEILPDEPVDYVALSSAGEHVAGVLDMTAFLAPGTRPQWIPYFWFERIDAGIERATSLGAWVVVPRTKSPTGDYALIEDPYGSLFGLWDGESSAATDAWR